jgi:thioredoxin-related protein
MKKNLLQNILLAIIVLVVAGNAIIIARLTSEISLAMANAIEMNNPVKLSAVIIEPSKCEACFDIDAALEGIKRANVLFEDEKVLDASDEKAQELIAKYAVQSLPTIILTGEINKNPELEEAWKNIGELKEDAVIFTKLQPPYFSVAEDRVIGQVTVTFINDNACEKCPTYEGYISQLEQGGVNIPAKKTMNYSHSEAQSLIKKYGITHIPTFILDKEIEAYPAVVSEWPKIGTVADDGSYVATPIGAPYRDTKSGQIEGLVSLISLIDSTCEECVDVSQIKQLIAPYRVALEEERLIDVNTAEGQALVEKYGITGVPTIILNSELDAYPPLSQAWGQVGSQESDGNYILRNLSIMKGAKYKDLTTDTIITN